MTRLPQPWPFDQTPLVSCIDLPMKVETQSGDFHGTRGRTIGDPGG